MLKLKNLVIACCLCTTLPVLASQENYPVKLTGHAILPAQSFIQAPTDASDNLRVSGKFTTNKRIDTLNTLEGKSFTRPTGVFLPFSGQPLQGHSGIKRMPDGSFWLLTDNGAGNKMNSPDFMLYLNQYDVDFKTGQFKLLKTIFLHDPDKNVPFKITQESTKERYLTGADFDPESFQFAGGYLWIGDEFGPYLIKADLQGKVLEVFETKVDGKVVHSPDHFMMTTPGKPDGKIEFEVSRSKGFEGMASSMNGDKLYALLEGPLYNNEKQSYENENDKQYLRILEFDVAKEEWTGRFWRYPLEINGNAIGDFNMISDDIGLIIERDNKEGVVEKSCTTLNMTDVNHCFDNVAEFKRVYKVQLNESNVNNDVNKIGYIDLLNIADPDHIAKKALDQDVFKFPFFTIEDVDIVDKRHIVVGNDNNLPFSSSREPNRADDNELILLELEEDLY